MAHHKEIRKDNLPCDIKLPTHRLRLRRETKLENNYIRELGKCQNDHNINKKLKYRRGTV